MIDDYGWISPEQRELIAARVDDLIKQVEQVGETTVIEDLVYEIALLENKINYLETELHNCEKE